MNRRRHVRPARNGVTLPEVLVALALLSLLFAMLSFAMRGGAGCGRTDTLRLRAECDSLAARLLARLRDDLRSASSLVSAGDVIELSTHRLTADGPAGSVLVRYESRPRMILRREGTEETEVAWDFSGICGVEGTVGLSVVRKGDLADAAFVVRSPAFPEPLHRRVHVRTGIRGAEEGR